MKPLAKIISDSTKVSETVGQSLKFGDLKRREYPLVLYYPPTCTAGRRFGSGSAFLRISCVTGAVSPSPKIMNFTTYQRGFPSVHPK
jgi:hypothetical protein